VVQQASAADLSYNELAQIVVANILHRLHQPAARSQECELTGATDSPLTEPLSFVYFARGHWLAGLSMHFHQWKRRDFIALLGGAAAWPLAARAQQRVRRIGVLIPAAADDAEYQTRIAVFLQGLQELGWTVGRNLAIDFRWATTDPDKLRQYAAELVALGPDVIFTSNFEAVRLQTRTVPTVFVNVIDPVSMGYVASLARPGGNATGFTLFEFGLSGKWPELLKQIAPGTTRVGVLRNPSIGSMGQVGAIQAVAPLLGVELTPIDARGIDEIEQGITSFARQPNGGLIVVASNLAGNRKTIIALASRHRLPTIYPFSYYVRDGGLLSYGPSSTEHYRRAAGYIDRILKGEKPADLPVQAPTKYELVINLKTAKALGLDVPASVLARADEVVE
jgi:putative ABC transport system substrate-binding protein